MNQSTSGRLTPADLEAIRARAEAATPGPWVACPSDFREDEHACDGITTGEGRYAGDDIVRTDAGVYPPRMPDAEFIAHARTDVPALLTEVRASWAERDAARKQVDDLPAMIARSNESHATAAQLRAERDACAAAEVTRLRSVLKRLEWLCGLCPRCGSNQRDGTHARGCIIGVEVGLVRP